jgi:hypothetical protein
LPRRNSNKELQQEKETGQVRDAKIQKQETSLTYPICDPKIKSCTLRCNLQEKPPSKLSKLHVGIKHQMGNKFKKN